MTLASGEGDPAKVVASWLERPARIAAALLSGFDRAGVGVATDSEGIPYWVILLAQGVPSRRGSIEMSTTAGRWTLEDRSQRYLGTARRTESV